MRAVVSTNALELGIDIGALDVSVMAGYPGTIASTWQRAGRAGRRQTPSAAVLVASSAPLDQYIVNHPEYFLNQPPERGLVNPDNTLTARAVAWIVLLSVSGGGAVVGWVRSTLG